MAPRSIDQATAFERQIERIVSVLESSDAIVTWNDRIPDPDNPKQLRQIDISLKRNGSLTLVECRDYRQPQDVKWVEELVGRRMSLRADAIIGVSSSGFTRGAHAKAESLGVVLRELREISESELVS